MWLTRRNVHDTWEYIIVISMGMMHYIVFDSVRAETEFYLDASIQSWSFYVFVQNPNDIICRTISSHLLCFFTVSFEFFIYTYLQ